ncbi:MAG: HAD hydrolase-like protein [Proteobacteria bacterium]|nr:HAD hydrolase-like protein [Pseudomonadota bacterium]
MNQLDQHIAAKKHVIWDWNGTLLNDVDIAVKAVSKLLKDHSLPSLDVAKYKEVFGFPIRDYYKRIGLDTSQMEELSQKFHQEYDHLFHECALFDGVKQALVKLKAQKKRQSILSAAQEAWLTKQLTHFDIHHLFDHVFGLTDFLANSKVERGRELIRESTIHPKDTILIGDTDHDVDVARELGIDVVIYADGHQSYSKLKKVGVPVYLRFN